MSAEWVITIDYPMMNGQFDIGYNPATGEVINRQLGGGTAIFKLTGPGSLQGSDAATALMRAVNDQNVDDTFTTVSFFVSEANVLIIPIGTHAVGDRFTITGSTNLAVGGDLIVEVYSSSFGPTQKNRASGFSGLTGIVKVVPGTGGYNRWSFDVDTATFKPDEYIVKVSAVTQDVSGTTTFNVVERLPTTQPPTTVPMPLTVTPSPTLSAPLPSPSTTQKAATPIEGIVEGIGVLTVLYCLNKRLND